MMIVAFGKAFTVAEANPKKLIMNTLARAAIERDRALEDDGGDESERLLAASAQATPALNESRMGTVQRNKAGSAVVAVCSPLSKQRVTFENGGGEGHDVYEVMPGSPR